MWPLLILAMVAVVTSDCPRHCECKWRSGKESALCARAGITAIPPRLPSTTQLLDLSENKINNLRDDIFTNAGLLNLQRLYLGSCSIKYIRQHAFRGLVNLVELDLSRNRLEAVPSNAFAEIQELRELRLDGNPIIKVKDEAFISLHHLVRLSLKSCKIIEIEPRSFVGVEGTLEYLEVNKNRLQVLHVAALAPLRSLKGLELANNPWECNCALRPLRDWMIRRNVPATIVPECSLPPRLMSQSWDRLDLEDFACPPEVSATNKHTLGTEGGDVILICKVTGIPAPRLRWLRGGRLLANSTGPQSVQSGRIFILKSEGQTSNLTIKSVDLQDAGSYLCSAENRAGKAEIIMTLSVERHPPDKIFGGRALLAGVAVSAVIILSVCLVALCLYETRKKSQLDRRNEQMVTINRRAESYEKIEMNVNKNETMEPRRAVTQSDNGRKRGDYTNVPCNDPEDETGILVPGNHLIRPIPRHLAWQRADVNPPQSAWICRREPDLHIPRLTEYNLCTDKTPDSVPSSTSTGILGIHSHIPDDNRLNNNTQVRTKTRTFPRDRLDNDLSGSDSEKNYPDLIEMSALGASYLKKRDPYFYTIPRRKDTDSRSPLLGSRRNSSGGDSYSSYECGPKHGGRRSNSFLDLAAGSSRSRRNPSLPSSPNRERPSAATATPLLDLSGLRDYSRVDQPLEDYDFRASQLEKFLDEYRHLREQLSKMKETRENLQRNRAADIEELRSIMKGKPSIAVTETSSLATIADAASPLTLGAEQHARPEWLSTLLYRK